MSFVKRHANNSVATPRKAVLVALMLTLALTIAASGKEESALATNASEWRTVTLEDGSKATLGPRTVLTHSFRDDQRRIKLIQGEALFDVQKDPRRPFVVETLDSCAKAVGTIFAVRRQLQSTSVTTLEGIVAVGRLDRTDRNCIADTVRLYAGQQVVVESWTPLVARAIDPEVEFAWTSRKIIFTGQRVEEALREFNRRNWVQLEMPDSKEGLMMRVYGSFPLDDPGHFAYYLEKQLRGRSDRR